MRILITGCLGFVGTNVFNRLTLNKDLDVWGVDNLSFGNLNNIKDRTKIIIDDFANLTNLKDYDVLIHLATSNIIYQMKYPIETFKNNSLKTIQLFDKFRGKIIYTSTASVYGNNDTLPTKETDTINVSNAYDQSKYIAELFLKQHSNYSILRLSNVYGEYQRPDNMYSGVVSRIIYSIMNNLPITVYDNGTATRDFTYVQDICYIIESMLQLDNLNTQYNICSSEEISIINLINIIKNTIAPNTTICIKNESKRLIDTISRRWLDNSKIKELLPTFEFTDISTGLKYSYEWICKNYML